MLRTGPRRWMVSGVSFVELMLAVTALMVLSLAALPTARTIHRRTKEKQLKRSLEQIRTALDEYHHDWERGYIEGTTDTGWPATLDELMEEMEYNGPTTVRLPNLPEELTASPFERRRRNLLRGRNEDEVTTKVYLARIPRDPFNRWNDEWDTMGWRARASDQDPDDSAWGGDDVYDVRSSSDWKALDGTLYEEW